ncbi:Dabb family protein [Flagellimonas beolgyonensis]|uniref:Dabb family protein n=1 Tax=Flagellimonas beolgyonensis TaxID=864064 RepID=UPI003D64FD1C
MKFNVLFVAFLILMSCNTPNKEATTNEPEMEKSTSQLRHVVLFQYKDTSTPQDIAKVDEAFAALPSKISEIKGFEMGLNNSPENLNKGFTHCYFLTFESEKDRDTYLTHPDHVAFGNILSPHLQDVLVVDYWTK